MWRKRNAIATRKLSELRIICRFYRWEACVHMHTQVEKVSLLRSTPEFTQFGKHGSVSIRESEIIYTCTYMYICTCMKDPWGR